MAYDESALSPVDPVSLAWAIAFLRMLLRDTLEPGRYADAELVAALELRAFKVDGVAYFRPHTAAAALIRSDPDRAISVRIDNVSETRRDPGSVASGIERDWVSIDDLIEAESGARPASGRTFRPVW